MNKIGKIEYRTISRISPSQYYSMKNCAYKTVLAEAFGKNPLLPVSPNTYLGTALHKMLALISRGEILNETEFNSRFDSEILLVENDLKENGYTFFIPLQMNIRDFGMKKIQLIKHLRNATESLKQHTDVKFTSEKWFESKDKLVCGKMDLIIESEDETEIIDFKTGAITEDVFDDNGESWQEVKKGYQVQLMLYAYLFFDSSGRFPTKLSLVDLAKKKFNIEFSEEECKAVFIEAKRLLRITNDNIITASFSANPNETNCKYCLYRPACSFFLKHLQTDYSFNDVTGSIKNVVKYQNGNVSVFLENEGRKILITNFNSEKYEELSESRTKQMNIFNLKKEATEFVYSAIKTTMIYE